MDVIFPFVGPPIICFGCFFTFPPNIKIDVPEFCIQLFGLKIGNCPKNKDGDGDGDGGGGDDNKDDDNDDDDDDDEKPSKKSEKPESTKASRTRSTTSSASTSTTSSCTTTVTATHEKVFCSVYKDDYSPKLVRNVPIDAPEEEQYAVTHNWITFKHKVEALAVEGLAGCLSIVIISSRGAWASHFYENTLADEELFDEAMEEWRSGRDEDDPMFEFAPYGLDQLKNNPDLGDLGIMFGDDRDPDENLDVLAFVIAPRPRPSYWDANGNLIPDALLQHPAINLNTFAYPQRNRRIATELLSIFGRGRINMLLPNYAPITLIYSEWDAWRKGYVPSDEYNSLLKDTECKSHRGKFNRKFVYNRIVLEYSIFFVKPNKSNNSPDIHNNMAGAPADSDFGTH
ncbi:hypothetical protein EsH8_X_000656 [Colletotrichum jinshuiense]